jgi:hypothetical protein
VVDDVREVVGGQPEVDGDEDRADLRHGIEGLELLVNVRRDVRHPVTLADAELLEGRGPPVTAVEEGFVSQAEIPVDHRLSSWMQAPSAPHELEWRKRRLHQPSLLPLPGSAASVVRHESRGKTTSVKTQKPNGVEPRWTFYGGPAGS